MTEIKTYKCPNCNAPLVFNPKSGEMSCEYCGTEFSAEDTKEYIDAIESEKSEESTEWENYEKDESWSDEEKSGMRTYLCPSCGGEVVGDVNTAATVCPYCGNPTVVSENISDFLKPDLIIPFKIGESEAKEAFKKHYSRKKLIPKEFSEKNHIEEIKGIYVPFWFFDCDTNSDITYKATKTRFWSDSDYNYTETRHYLVRRAGTLSFESIPADGSSKIDDTVMQSIEPFRKSSMTEFSPTYLAGFLADKYDVDSEVQKGTVNARVRQSVADAFRNTVIGYSSVIPTSSNINITSGKVKYGLMPVWMLNTKFNEKQYTFAMNADTGRFVGDLPVSWKRFFGYLFGISGVAFAVISAILLLAELL